MSLGVLVLAIRYGNFLILFDIATDGLPRIPPVQYYIEFEGLEGESVATMMTKKVEIDPFTIAENEPKEVKPAETNPGSTKEKGKSKSKESSRDGAVSFGLSLYQFGFSQCNSMILTCRCNACRNDEPSPPMDLCFTRFLSPVKQETGSGTVSTL